MATTVVKIGAAPFDVLIDRSTVFGNPFKEWQWGREGCIHKFETYFYSRIERDPEWKAKILELKGKVLGCHCKPLACHGDVYAEFLDAYDQVEKAKVQAQLACIIDRVNSLATDHGWYEPELQGEALYAASQIDSPITKSMATAAEKDPEYDVIRAITEYLEE